MTKSEARSAAHSLRDDPTGRIVGRVSYGANRYGLRICDLASGACWDEEGISGEPGAPDRCAPMRRGRRWTRRGGVRR